MHSLPTLLLLLPLLILLTASSTALPTSYDNSLPPLKPSASRRLFSGSKYWADYVRRSKRGVPPYDPPDLGPRRIDTSFFDSEFPGLTPEQQRYQMHRYLQLHDASMRFIANKYPSVPPTPEQLRAVIQKFHEKVGQSIRKAQWKTARQRGFALAEPGDVEAAVRKMEARLRPAKPLSPPATTKVVEEVQAKGNSRKEQLRQEIERQEVRLQEMRDKECRARDRAAYHRRLAGLAETEAAFCEKEMGMIQADIARLKSEADGLRGSVGGREQHQRSSDFIPNIDAAKTSFSTVRTEEEQKQQGGQSIVRAGSDFLSRVSSSLHKATSGHVSSTGRGKISGPAPWTHAVAAAAAS